ncbi:MAG: patatin-like phospholipase family protein [Clostridia bacterium]|nr:patatin-like phospholipase family protein [Clostridia bacterium]
MSFWGKIRNLFKRKPAPTFKMGLALGSGGAKGFAELGALYCFEQHGIEFDIVAGTSIGSILGAFYAAGYSSTDCVELFRNIKATDIKNFFMINMDTAGLFKVIDRTIGDLDIEELKKPFCAIATELDTGREKVFKSGKVAQALCASSSYPPFFRPVVEEGKKFIDGAFANAMPADKVKEMGADFVVGIDISTRVKSGGNMLSLVFPEFKGGAEDPYKNGYENADFVLHPDLTGYKSVSFTQWRKLFDIGYAEALQKMPEIQAKINAAKIKKGIKIKR